MLAARLPAAGYKLITVQILGAPIQVHARDLGIHTNRD